VTAAMHMILPAAIWYAFTRDTGLVYHLCLAAGVAPDFLPLMLQDRYKLIKDMYKKIHQPWQFGYWWMYIIWVLIPPLGLHCLMDIPVHNPDTTAKNIPLGVGVELSCYALIVYIMFFS